MQPEVFTKTTTTRPEWEPKRFDMIAGVARILRRYRMIAAVTGVIALLALAYAMTRKPYFEGVATFMPPQRDASVFGAASGGLFLGGGLFGAQQSAMYVGFLNSRSVQEDVVKRAHLMERFKIKDPDAARGMVASESKFDMQTNGVITVLIHDGEAQRAADIANAYLAALYDLNKRISQMSVTQRGEFYNDQVKAARVSLEAAETQLLANQEQGGILDPQGALQVSMSTEARLQASIQAAEVELSALTQGQTEQSPEVVRLRSRIGELRSQLAQQSSKPGQHVRGVQAGGAIPRLSIEAMRRRRDVQEREAIYEALLRQADYTKLNAEDPGPQLQVIDSAVTNKYKAGPNRARIVIIGMFVGLTLSCLWAAAEPTLRANYARLRVATQAGA
jgi:tyrosine-protein kinase Etk/Wzc